MSLGRQGMDMLDVDVEWGFTVFTVFSGSLAYWLFKDELAKCQYNFVEVSFN